MFKRIFEFLIYSNIFIAACAVLMCYQASWLLAGRAPNLDFIGFVFSSTICSYSFHWYLTEHSVLPSERITWLRKHKGIHVFFFFAGLAAAAWFFFQLIEYWPWLFIAAFVTFLYSAPKIPHPWFRLLRKVALGKTIFLAFVWMFVTTVLPVIMDDGRWTIASTLFTLSRFFLIYAICILFDYRDRDDDKEAGIKSLITYLDERGIRIAFYFSLLIFFVSSIWMVRYGISWFDIVIILIPGFITGGLFGFARKHFHDLFYYFVLDGLMALSAVLMLLSRV
jgi:hypothetical protein